MSSVRPFSIRCVSAVLTHDTEMFSNMDPYVIIECGIQRRKTRTHNEGGKRPSWNDQFTFNYPKSNKLILIVMDQDNLTDDLIGEGSIDLNSIVNDSGIYNKFQIKLLYKKRNAGVLNIAIKFQSSSQPGQWGTNNNIPYGTNNTNNQGNQGNNINPYGYSANNNTNGTNINNNGTNPYGTNPYQAPNNNNIPQNNTNPYNFNLSNNNVNPYDMVNKSNNQIQGNYPSNPYSNPMNPYSNPMNPQVNPMIPPPVMPLNPQVNPITNQLGMNLVNQLSNSQPQQYNASQSNNALGMLQMAMKGGMIPNNNQGYNPNDNQNIQYPSLDPVNNNNNNGWGNYIPQPPQNNNTWGGQNNNNGWGNSTNNNNNGWGNPTNTKGWGSGW